MWDLSSLTKDRTYIPWIGRWVLSQGSFYFCFCGGVEPKRYSCIPYDPAFPLLGYIFKGNEISLPKRSAPLHSLQHGLPKYPSVDKWTEKMCLHTHTHTHEYYWDIKMKEVLMFAAIWMHLKWKKSEKGKCRVISLTYKSLRKETHSHTCKANWETQVGGF